MVDGTIISNHARRLEETGQPRLLDTSPEAHLDAVCRTAVTLLRVPIALIACLDERRLWFKARHGLALDGIDRAGSFCEHTIRQRPGDTLVVPDLARDPRFRDSPLVAGDPHLRFYAGTPIAARSGENIATLALLDTVPRDDFGSEEMRRLQDLALIVQAHLGLHEAQAGYAVEMAERLRVERRLRMAHDWQAMAERTARFGHWRIDTLERSVVWSEGIARIFGRNATLDRLSLHQHLSFYQADDREKVRELINEAAMGGGRLTEGGYEHTSRILRPDGEMRFVSVRGIPERGARGRVVGLYGVCLDVTDLIRAEQTQRETSELLRMTLESMSQGLLMIGPDDRVRIHNQRAHELLDLPEDMLRDGAPFGPIREYQLSHGEFDRTSARLRGWVESGELEGEPLVYERERPNGMILEVRAVPLPDGGVVRTLTDVTRRRQVERAVQKSEQRFRLLAENTSDVIIWSDLNTTRRYVSPAVAAVLGYRPEELVGTRPLDFVHPDDVEAYGAILGDLQQGRTEQVVTAQRYRHKDGRWIWIEVSFKLTRDPESGGADGYVAALRDITERRAAETALRLSEERLSLALDSGSDGLWDWNLATGAVELSTHWFAMLGYEAGDIEQTIQSWERLVHPEDAERARRLLADHFEGRTATYECEYRLRKRNGDYAWTLARGKVVAHDAEGRPYRMVGTHIDITRRKEAEQQIAHMAAHDALTGLPNRLVFRDRLNQELTKARLHEGRFAVFACDLDRFKAVNDTFGHPSGDALLREIAARLRSVVREGDTVARLGGDEFAIILDWLDEPAAASLTAQRLIEAVGQPVTFNSERAAIGVSIGIAFGDAQCRDADSLFKNADIALYRAKAAGRNTFSFYEPGMDADVAHRSLLERDLREAVRQGGFLLNFQPIMTLADGSLGGFEALLRWPHPERGNVPPAEFIPLAEETGLIVPLAEWALREACREAASWPGHLRIAVNVSPVQFRRQGLEQAVIGALASSGLAPPRLELEITESVLMSDSEAVIATLHRLRGLGVRIALDDFGTGYSSLSYLRRFPFDKIKIDRSFVRDITDPDTAAIVRAIVGIGERLGTAITAEGVETKNQMAGVRREGCTEVQGFLYSKPLTAIGARAFVRRRAARVAA